MQIIHRYKTHKNLTFYTDYIPFGFSRYDRGMWCCPIGASFKLFRTGTMWKDWGSIQINIRVMWIKLNCQIRIGEKSKKVGTPIWITGQYRSIGAAPPESTYGKMSSEVRAKINRDKAKLS